MSDLISRALLAGIGAASLTMEVIQKTVQDLVNQSKMSEEEGRKLVAALQKRSSQAQVNLEKEVDSAVHEVFQHLNLPAMIGGRLKGATPAHKKAKTQKPAPARKTSPVKKKPVAHKASPARKTSAVPKPAKKGSGRVIPSKMSKAKKPVKR